MIILTFSGHILRPKPNISIFQLKFFKLHLNDTHRARLRNYDFVKPLLSQILNLIVSKFKAILDLVWKVTVIHPASKVEGLRGIWHSIGMILDTKKSIFQVHHVTK